MNEGTVANRRAPWRRFLTAPAGPDRRPGERASDGGAPTRVDHDRATRLRGIGACVGIAVLLLVFCLRIWDLGIVHTDDAVWFVAARGGDWSIVTDFAKQQGRIWAFVSGALIYGALYFQGTFFGDLLRAASFCLFFVIFHAVVSIYVGRRLALLAAILNLALFAMRSEGSIVTTYPVFSWVLMSLSLAAIWLGLLYQRSGRPAFLIGACITLFVSLNIHESVSVLFAALCMLSVVANRYLLRPGPEAGRTAFWTRTTRIHGSAVVVTIGLYFSTYVAWRLLFRSNYEGNTLKGGDLSRMLPVLISFITSGNILSDLVSPYWMSFTDAVKQDQFRIVYAPAAYWNASSDGAGPAMSVVAILVATYSVITLRGRRRARSSAAMRLLGGSALGAAIAIVPMLPVALVEKYQRGYYDYGVHDYAFTALSHFGLSLALAALVLYPVSSRFAGPVFRNAIAIVLAVTVAALGLVGARMNDAIANDARTDTYRWKAIDRAMALIPALGQPVRYIYSPRLFNATMFTAFGADFWSRYVEVVHGRTITFSPVSVPLSALGKDAAYLDFTSGGTGSASTVVLAPLVKWGPGEAIVANRIVATIDRAGPSELSQFLLHFKDVDRGLVQTRFASLESVQDEPSIRLVTGALADPRTIALEEFARPVTLVGDCDETLHSGMTMILGTANSDQGNSCNGAGLSAGGWNAREKGGVWSRANDAGISIYTSGLQPGALVVTITSGTLTELGFADTPQTLTIRIGGRTVLTRTGAKGSGMHVDAVLIPAESWKPGTDLTLRFDVNPIVNPAKQKGNGDVRDLGVHLVSIKVDVR